MGGLEELLRAHKEAVSEAVKADDLNKANKWLNAARDIEHDMLVAVTLRKQITHDITQDIYNKFKGTKYRHITNFLELLP